MFFSAVIENLPKRGVIRIRSTSTGEPPGDVEMVRVKRRISETMIYATIMEIPILSSSDFSFEADDNECRSGVSYDYQIIPVANDGTEQVGVFLSIKSSFDGIYTGDGTSEWMCDLNPDYDYNVNTSVFYVKPLMGKHPIRVSNGDTRYATGTVQGLFLPKDANGCYTDILSILSAARAYKDSFLDFLCNGETKLLKTHDGHVWRVGVDANPKEISSKFFGASEIKFAWTEIDDPPEV